MALSFIKSAGRAFYRARGYYSATIRGNEFKLDPYHFAFLRAASQERWEPSTFDVITKYLSSESTYIDIGAWIGPTVLHAARHCKEVYCFEPDPTALRYLNWNLDLNDIRNVHSLGVAVAARPGIFRMATFGDNPGDSKTSLLQNDAEYSVRVLAITWADFIQKSRPENVTLIKVDAEGAEFELIPTMRDYLEENKPALFLSTHAPYLEDSNRIDAMTKLADSLAFYPCVFDEFLNPTSCEELTSIEATKAFGTYLFTAE